MVTACATRCVELNLCAVRSALDPRFSGFFGVWGNGNQREMMRCVCKLLDQVTDSSRLVNKEISVSASFGYIESYIMVQVGTLQIPRRIELFELNFCEFH